MQGAVDGGNTFADARFVDWRLDAVDGDVVFAGPQVIDVVHEAIDEGHEAVDVGHVAVDEGDTIDENTILAGVVTGFLWMVVN